MDRVRREAIKVMLFAFSIFAIIFVFSNFIKRWIEEKIFEEMVKWARQ